MFTPNLAIQLSIAKIKKDYCVYYDLINNCSELYSFAHILAVFEHCILAINTTMFPDGKDYIKKIKSDNKAYTWIMAGGIIQTWEWRIENICASLIKTHYDISKNKLYHVNTLAVYNLNYLGVRI